MLKTQTVEAIYENGILRPLQELENLPEQSQVKVTIELLPQEQHPLLQFAGIISDSEAQEL